MTIKVKHFTPERLLEASRRSPGYPSPDGKLVLHTCTKYSFDSHSNSNEICVLDIATGVSTVLSKNENVSEPNWLGDGYSLLWLKSGENGNTSIIISNAQRPGHSYVAGIISGPVSSLKLRTVRPGVIAIAVAGQANPDGSLYNPKDAPKSYSSARVYDSLFVRHWDTYLTKQRNSIFTGALQFALTNVTNQVQRYTLVGFTNALQGTGLECPIPPFGGTDHFDIGPEGLVIVAKDPELDQALHTKCNAYFIAKSDFADLSVMAKSPQKIVMPGFKGAATSPVFSPYGNSLAFLQMKQDCYESDRNSIIFVPNLKGDNQIQAQEVMDATTSDTWDRSPLALIWSHDGRTIYVQAENKGTGGLFAISVYNEFSPNPRQLTNEGYITAMVPASKTSPFLFVSGNSLVDSSTYAIIDPTFSQPPTIISSISNFGKSLGLSAKQVRSLYWTGDKGRVIHAWIMVPSWFKPDQKYPLALLIHGGPQNAWNDQWSTRWNPAVFAEQGYIVVCPNITGSTGYGQGFTDAIKADWGGSPYIDIEKGLEYIENELSFADASRTVALGASYGGYMMNWIQGKPLGRRMKTLVCHDGIFSMVGGQLSTDELYFPNHDMGGTMWDKQSVWDKWDPSRYVKNWATPMLVIHNDLDYRLPVSEGLAAFNVLRTKGVETRFLSFPDENHWVVKHENSLVWHLVVLNWINRFVGLPAVVDRNGCDGSEYLMSR